jgi:hypothetical protein
MKDLVEVVLMNEIIEFVYLLVISLKTLFLVSYNNTGMQRSIFLNHIHQFYRKYRIFIDKAVHWNIGESFSS